MEDFYEKACLCTLNKAFGFKPGIALALLQHIGTAGELFRMSAKDKETMIGTAYPKEASLISARNLDETMRELERLAKTGVSFVGWSEQAYPQILKECPDAPVGLYIKSRTPVQELFGECSRNIAVIGTRDISPYGREWCARIIEGMASVPVKPVIISGLALGTDICAHRSALRNGIPTIAVMATGPDEIYPMRHRNDAETIAGSPGSAIITDYPPGTKALPIHFLRRNRIIAGLSKATILIESRIKGGGMMTSRLAFSYNREVYALPGRVDDPCSQGCNKLIKAKIAEPIISVDDLSESLGLGKVTCSSMLPLQDQLQKTYGSGGMRNRIGMMSTILLTVRNNRGISVEELAASCGFGYSVTSELAVMLETDGFISIDILQRCSICTQRA